MSEQDDADDAEMAWKHVNVRVRQHRYNEWTEHVGDGPGKFGSISELIRFAVEKHTNDEGPDRRARGERSDVDLSPVTDEVLPALNRIERRIDEIDTTVDAVAREEQADTGELDLERIIYELLPVRDEVGGELEEAMTIPDLCSATGASPDDIREAIDSLNDWRKKTVIADDSFDKNAAGSVPTQYYRSE